MKKKYFAPEIEILKISVTDLILGPSLDEGHVGDMGDDLGDLGDLP